MFGFSATFSDSAVYLLIVFCCVVSTTTETDLNNVGDMSRRSSSIDIHDLQDIPTPFGKQLSGIYKKSFAYTTIKDRLPVILTKVIDTLSRNKETLIQKYGQDTAEEIKRLVGFVSKLKNEIATNKTLKPLRPLENATDDDDTEIWNRYLGNRTQIEGETPMWFNTIWLFSECYMYRVLVQEIALLRTLNEYDPFREQKNNGLIGSLGSISILSGYVMNIIRSANLSDTEKKVELSRLMRLNLWSNRCDLSLSAGVEQSQSGDPIELLKSLDNYILVDDTDLVWNVLKKRTIHDESNEIVDIVLDNAGYELFTDLCLAMFLVSHNFTDKIRFYVKRFPWYVSDTTVNDFHWTLKYMNDSSIPELREFGRTASQYVDNGIWSIENERYWTGPYDYAEMKKQDPALYAKLSMAKLVIFKGDLNYRKLLGDINWEYTTSFLEALRDFRPTNVLSLRTVKADICVGLPSGKAQELFRRDEDWMITGQYGLIQSTIHDSCPCSTDRP